MTAHRPKDFVPLDDRPCLGPLCKNGEKFTPKHRWNRLCPRCTIHNAGLGKQESRSSPRPQWKSKQKND